jgi:hypothetical protein
MGFEKEITKITQFLWVNMKSAESPGRAGLGCLSTATRSGAGNTLGTKTR